MSLPVPFKEFGSTNEALYREYCLTYREAVQVFRFSIVDDASAWGGGGHAEGGWNGYGGHAARRGAVGGSYRGVPVKCSLPWRAPAADGGAGVTSRRGFAATGGAVGGVTGGCDGAPTGGVGGVGDADHVGGVGVGGETRGERDAATVGDGQRGDHFAAGGGGSEATAAAAVVRGKHYEKNKARRERAKALRDARNVSGRDKNLVSVRAAHPELDETWAARKVRENKVAIARLDTQLAKIKKEEADGTAERRYQVEANLVRGQLDGAFALVPQRRVVSWAKTITSNGSSSAGSSGGKKSQASIPSVSSGLGSGSATTVSARERRLEEENERLKKQMVTLEETERAKRLDLGNGVDRLNRQHVSEVIALKQQLKAYQLRYG